VLTEAQASRRVDRQADTGAPTQPTLVARHRLDLHVPFDAPHAPELIGDADCLESTLRRYLHVLEVASATATRTGVGARGSDAIWRGSEYVGGVGPDERRRARGDAGYDTFPGQRVTHEDDAAIGGMADAATTAGDVAHIELEYLGIPDARHGAHTRGGAAMPGIAGAKAWATVGDRGRLRVERPADYRSSWMMPGPTDNVEIDFRMTQLFALVSEALAGATDALLGNDSRRGLLVVEGDQSVDDLTAEVELMVWKQIDDESTPSATLRHLVGFLLIVPELERSGDLAEHIAQRAVTNLGVKMSPLSRGIIQRMAEVALEMWRDAADAYGDRAAKAEALSEADEEIDILHARLTKEIAAESMPTAIGAQVTLLARFYERLGDHAVNLARRIEMLHRPA
jgi:phosphate transport system protein